MHIVKVKYFFFWGLLLMSIVTVSAQNKIGDNQGSIMPGSILELESVSKGLRLPRIVLNDINRWTLDGTPVSGMLIFNESGTAAKGLYYWDMDKSKWVNIVNTSDLVALIATNTSVTNNSTGNRLTTTVNGVTSLGTDIVKNNSLTLIDGVLTSTVNGVVSTPGLNLLSSVDNGLSSGNGNAQLGGPLIKPTTLSTSTTNTLAIKGLQNGNVNTDSILVVASNTGIIRKINTNELTGNGCKSIVLATTVGQRRFSTPVTITDIRKVQVYRNGVNVEFTQVDDTHIDLETQAACYVDDEIKIIQLK